MNHDTMAAWGPRLTFVLMAGVGVMMATLAWLGFRATREWQHSSALIVQRRAEESADLLLTALTRDMRGAQTSVLASRDWRSFSPDALSPMSDQVSSAFARYPYPESFFGWRQGRDTRIIFFNRANRPPRWTAASANQARYPVVLVIDPPIGRPLLARIQHDVAAGRRYSIFETTLGGEPYQIVARLQYEGEFRETLQSVFAYTVNLDWVRRSYFAEITNQVTQIRGGDVSLAVLDDRAHLISGRRTGAAAAFRRFPLLFFDPSLVLLDPPLDLAVRHWRVEVSAGSDPTLMWATGARHWMVLAMGAAALTLVGGLVLSIRAVRASADLAALRGDFVSTVTHELKTPLATIRAVGDTLVRGRLTSEQALREYAQLLVQESKHLTRLVDNLLAYARVTDVTEVYSFEPLAAAELIEDVLQEFRHQFAEGGFAVHVEASPDLPLLRGDRTALRLALRNLIDNAARYAGDERWIEVAASRDGHRVLVDVRDRGVGIPGDELASVQRKYVRGRFARASGSGLGLAIVNRIVTDHGGVFTLDSQVGAGTTARLDLPVFEG